MPLIYTGSTYVNTTDPLYLGNSNNINVGGDINFTQNTTLNSGATFSCQGSATFNGATAFTALPTCSVTPTSANQLSNKSYVDGSISTFPTLAGANAWTGTNTYNTNLPTSTVTPTTSTQLITKAYADATYATLFTATAVCPVGSTVTIATIPIPAASTVVNVFGWYVVYNFSASDTSGFFNGWSELRATGGPAGTAYNATTFNTLAPVITTSGNNIIIQGGSDGIASITWTVNYFVQIGQ